MRRAVYAAAAGACAAGAARLAYSAMSRRPPGGPKAWSRTNHRGEPVTLLEGPAVAAGAITGVLAQGVHAALAPAVGWPGSPGWRRAAAMALGGVDPLSQHAGDGPGGHGGPLEQGDRLAPVVGARPHLRAARRAPVRGGVREPGRARRGRARGRRGDQSQAGPAHFFPFLVDGVDVALGDTVGVGAGLGATAVAPLAVNP